VKVLGWLSAILIITLNFWLAHDSIAEWAESSGSWIWAVVTPLAGGLVLLLAYVIGEPWLPEAIRSHGRPVDRPLKAPPIIPPPVYHRILV
ncbi:hypothetical protein ABTM44_17890, partial [Acinetobacter baumannii]